MFAHDRIPATGIVSNMTFDQFAAKASNIVSRGWFFALCVLLILVWAPSFLVIPSIDTWQLVINSTTTVVTFLLVALLQNSQKRSEDALQHKLNAIANGLADLMEAQAELDPELECDTIDLRKAVGIEDPEK